MGDDTMRVVPKNVFPRRGKDLGAVEASGEIGGEEGPDAHGAQVLRAAGEGAGVAGRGEEEVEDVGEEEGPEEGDGTEEEEGGEEDGDGEGVPEDDKGLEPAFERDVEGGEADAVGSGSLGFPLV